MTKIGRFLVTSSGIFLLLLAVAAWLYYWSVNNYPIDHENSLLHLDLYQVTHNKAIEGIGDQLSGLTYSPVTDSLFGVTDSPSQIVELSFDGRVKRIISLEYLSDTEGITHVRDDLFVITEESKRLISFVRINGQTQSISTVEQTILLNNVVNYRNKRKGPEGIAWSDKLGLLVANEQQPATLSQIDLAGGLKDYKVVANYIVDLPLKDLAGLYAIPKTPHVIVLSDESRRILEIDQLGNVLSQFKLTSGPFDLIYTMEQPEGIAMDSHENIYVVGEPNVFVVLQKK